MIRPIVYCALLGASIGTNTLAAQTIPSSNEREPKKNVERVTLNFNALEASRVSHGDTRLRALVDVSVNLGKMQLNYKDFSEGHVTGGRYHFGRHALSVKKKDTPWAAVVAAYTTQDGLADVKGGAERTLDGLFGIGYGYATASYGRHGPDIWVVVGKEFTLPGEKSNDVERNALEYFGEASKNGRTPWTTYGEIEYLRSFGHGISGFVRAEFPQYKRSNATYLFGVRADMNPVIRRAARLVIRK